jgi:hypothetical protein
MSPDPSGESFAAHDGQHGRLALHPFRHDDALLLHQSVADNLPIEPPHLERDLPAAQVRGAGREAKALLDVGQGPADRLA